MIAQLEKSRRRARAATPPASEGGRDPSWGKQKKTKRKRGGEGESRRESERAQVGHLRCCLLCPTGPARAPVGTPAAPLLSLPAPAVSGRTARAGSQASAIPRGRLGFY